MIRMKQTFFLFIFLCFGQATVYSQKLSAPKTIIHTEALCKGVYFVKMGVAKKVVLKKLVIQ